MAEQAKGGTSVLPAGFDLAGRRTVVAGGRGGAGEAIAAAFGEAGAKVEAAWFGATDAAGAGNAVADAAARLGGLDVAVFVPPVYQAAPLADTSDAEASVSLAANLGAAIGVFRAASEAMGADGRLIAVLHPAALRGLSNLSVFGATQAGILGLVRGLSQELGPRGITANAIVTGWMTHTAGRGPDAVDQNLLLRFIPMRRFGDAEELAPLAVYLASTASGYVNGHVMAVDGGVLKHL